MFIRIAIPAFVLVSFLAMLSTNVALAQTFILRSCEEEANDPYSPLYGEKCADATETPMPVTGQLPTFGPGVGDPCEPGSPLGALVHCIDPLEQIPTATPEPGCGIGGIECLAEGTVSASSEISLNFVLSLSGEIPPMLEGELTREEKIKIIKETAFGLSLVVDLITAPLKVPLSIPGDTRQPDREIPTLPPTSGSDIVSMGLEALLIQVVENEGNKISLDAEISLQVETNFTVDSLDTGVSLQVEANFTVDSPDAPSGILGADPGGAPYTPIDPEMALTILPSMDHLHETCLDHLIYPVPPEWQPEHTESEFTISRRTGLPIFSFDADSFGSFYVDPATGRLINSATGSSSSFESTITMIERATSLSHPNASSITVFPGTALCSESGMQAAQQALDQAMNDATNYFTGEEFFETVVEELFIALGERVTKCTCARNTYLPGSQPDSEAISGDAAAPSNCPTISSPGERNPNLFRELSSYAVGHRAEVNETLISYNLVFDLPSCYDDSNALPVLDTGEGER